MSNILKSLNESLADEIMAIAKAKGMNPRLRGTPEQERERTQQMLAQRAKDREMNPPPKPTLSPEQVQQLKQELEQEQKDFDPYYEYSDDHGYWTKQKEKAQRIGRIKQTLSDAGVELKEAVEYKTVSIITEARTYKLWESAGQKLVEAQLTADQINQIFQYVQNIQTAGGDNRTLLGKGKDAASAVNKAWEDLKTKVQNSGPIKNVDALYDKAAEQLKQATGGDQGVMSYVQKYRDFAKKHPVAQSLIYSALIAAAGISGAGLGGAAALGLFKMVDKLLQGEKFSSAAYSGAKTGAMAYGASKLGDLVRGNPEADIPAGAADAAASGGKAAVAAARQAASKAVSDAISSGQITDYNSMLDATEQIMSTVGQNVSPMTADLIRKQVEATLYNHLKSQMGLTESINLSESQINLIISKIVEKQNLREGIMDTLKGAAGKAVDYAKTKGTNLTTKVTADKLLQAWKKAGSPTDSLDVASIIQKAGVPTDTITQVFNNMKIPAPGQPGGGAEGKRDIPVDPSSVAPPPSSPSATEPSSTATASTTTEPAQPKAAPSTSDYQKVKQLLAQLDKRGKMNLVKTLEKELAVTEDILSLSESELQLLAELSPETLASYKKKAGQSASQADKEGNYKLGDKRFSGIVRATKKELDKDVAKHKDVAEARRANTASARAELSNRPRKPESDKEKEDKKKESDAAWERLMQYAADQKKDVAEATMTPQQVAAAKAAAPYGYNPQTGKPNPAPAQRAPQQAPQAPAQTVQQRADATQQRLLDKMGARFGLPPGSSAEQVQAAQQAHLDKNDPKAAAQYKQNMANIDAGNTAANKPVQLAKPQAQAPQTMQQQDPDFYAGMQAQKSGGSPIDIMLAQPSIANNQKLLDAIGSVYGLPAGSTIEQIKAAASGKKAPAPQTSAVAESTNFEESFDMKINELAINEDWQKVNKKDKTDGMSKKAVKAYRRENPGSKLQTAVTTKPSKLKKGSKSAKRRKSFCARMKGMKKAHASAKTKRNPDSPINKALRRWNCESVEQMQQLVMIAEQKIALLKEAANPAQQAAIAISMKKKGQKPKSK